LKVGQVDINGNVYGKVAVGKHLIMEMENYIGGKKVNKKIKKVFDKMDPEIQEAVKFLINEIVVKRELKKLEKSEKKA